MVVRSEPRSPAGITGLWRMHEREPSVRACRRHCFGVGTRTPRTCRATPLTDRRTRSVKPEVSPGESAACAAFVRISQLCEIFRILPRCEACARAIVARDASDRGEWAHLIPLVTTARAVYTIRSGRALVAHAT